MRNLSQSNGLSNPQQTVLLRQRCGYCGGNVETDPDPMTNTVDLVCLWCGRRTPYVPQQRGAIVGVRKGAA